MHCSRCGTWAAELQAACATCGAPLQAGDGSEPARGLAGLAAPGSAAAPAPAVAPVYGGFWRRFAGHVIDAAVLFFPPAIGRVLMGLGVFSSGSSFSDRREWTDLAFSLLLGLFYQSVLQSSPLEGTLGQRVMDLRITGPDGRRLRYPRAVGRWLAQSLSWLTCGAGFLFLLWTPRRQTLHDLVAGTLVVRSPRHSRPAPAPAHRGTLEAR